LVSIRWHRHRLHRARQRLAEVFDSVFEARVLYNDWCDAYNRVRLHSSLGYLAPVVSRPR